MSTRFRAVLRLAVRDMGRHRDRTLLVVLLVGLPVAVVTTMGGFLATTALSAPAQARVTLGRADYVVESKQVLAPESLGLPSSVSTVQEEVSGTSTPDGEGRLAGVSLRTLEVGAPLVQGVLRLDSGRAPGPGEVAVSGQLAADLGAHAGALVHLGPPASGLDLRVSGLVTQAADIRARVALVSGIDPSWSLDAPVLHRLYVAGPGPAQLPPGASVTSRASLTGSAPVAGDVVGAGIVGGIVALVTVLLVSSAFLVGAKRQEHEMALLAACGGARRRDLAGVVLAGGVMQGAAGAALGVLLGAGGAVALLPLARRATSHLIEGAVLPARLFAAVWLLGLLAAAGAALVPARSVMRVPPLAAMRAVAHPAPPRAPDRRMLAAAGAGLVLLAVAVATAGRVAELSAGVGTVLLLVALAASGPAVLSRLDRASGRAPLPLRLALRDLARHPARSGPALGATAVALAVAVVMGCYWSTDMTAQRLTYQPQLRVGHVLVRDDSVSGTPVSEQVAARVRAALPVRADAPLLQLGTDDAPVSVGPSVGGSGGEVMVGGPVLLDLVTGSAGRAAFDGGAVVTTDRHLVRDGRSVLTVFEQGRDRALKELPAVVVDVPTSGTAEPRTVVSRAVAEGLGLPTHQQGWLFELERAPSRAERSAAEQALASAATGDLRLVVETGYQPYASRYLLALLGAALLLSIGVIAISLALAAQEVRSDLATLAAVGAPSRLQQRFGTVQALVLAAFAAAAAALAGVPVGLVLARTRLHTGTLDVPWTDLTAATLLLLALAGLVGRAVTSRAVVVARRSR